jgi:NAD(P)-dependent dehydrogenase (short-subunit alcohol dehydrogenase family)
MSNMSGRVVLVTGASQGIGKAIAIKLAREGVHVVLCARREEPLAHAVNEIRAGGGSAEGHRLDVADLEAYAALIVETDRKYGRFDGLVNNAMSATWGKTVLDMDIKEWRRDFAVNSDAAFIGTREALRLMVPRRQGAIVNIAALSGIRALPGLIAYNASKAALIHFSASAAIEVASYGVRINCIIPGQIVTPSTKALAEKVFSSGLTVAQTAPMQRPGKPEEIAEVAHFLLSDASSFVTATAIPVDGGKAAQVYVPT